MKTPNLFSLNKRVEEQINMNMQLSQDKIIRTIELFAGVGGFRIGLENVKNHNKKFKLFNLPET